MPTEIIMATALERDVLAFACALPDLLKDSFGKIALVHEGQVVQVCDSMEDALRLGYQEFRKDPFFVKEIAPIPDESSLPPFHPLM
jgi:hypothetical protein